ncbi:MAG: alpha-mannosidase, partial [Clostridia bacterium]|nr:alpha-mannosidase [Clostridia bacterium]
LRVRSVYRLGEHSTLTQDTVFYAHNPVVVFESKLDWNDHHKLIKADFSTNIMASTFKSEVQFGFLERPTTRNTSEEQAKYEVCNHKWTDLSETRFGVALLNQSKYGVSVRGKRMGLSLLKSGRRPDTSADCGVKYFNYALLPHEGGFSAESVVLPAYAFNRAPVAFGGEVQVPVCGISQPNVICETVKYAEDSDATVLRIYECERSYTDCVLTLSGEYEVYQTDMLEENPVLLATGREILLHFNQFEIKTLLLKKK